jgi:cell division control protein 24
MRIRGFDYYFSLISTDARRSTDPVSHLWDLFSLGVPLCFLFDLLPSEHGYPKINNSQFNEEEFEQNPDKPKKRAIAHFAMQVRTDRVSQTIPGCEPFTVTDLWDRNSTDGLVKVVHTVTAIVDHLPEECFDANTSISSDTFDASELAGSGAPANAQERDRNNITREMVETERKYVQDLEVMQKYANALAQGGIIDQDTIHLLFPNLNKLLNFQRKFLIRLESIAEQPWQNQRWGQPFIETEEEFVVYEPYCANYTNASELILTHEQTLSVSALFIVSHV